MASNDKSKQPKGKVNTSKITLPEGFLDKVAMWALFYRMYPFMFVEHTMGIKLKLFQKIQLYILNNYMMSTIIASRGKFPCHLLR